LIHVRPLLGSAVKFDAGDSPFLYIQIKFTGQIMDIFLVIEVDPLAPVLQIFLIGQLLSL